MNIYIIGAYIIWNIIVFLLYGVDKHKAKAGAWRIPEKTLLLCALFFGAVGALFGMKVFRHKTKHMKFKLLVPLLVILNVTVLCIATASPEKVAEFFKGLDNLI